LLALLREGYGREDFIKRGNHHIGAAADIGLQICVFFQPAVLKGGSPCVLCMIFAAIVGFLLSLLQDLNYAGQ